MRIDLRPVGRPYSGRVEQVLDEHGHSGERTGDAGAGTLERLVGAAGDQRIQLVELRHRRGLDLDNLHRIQLSATDGPGDFEG